MSAFRPGKCDVCSTETDVGVAAMPGVPISFAYCRPCLAANAHPWWLVVVNTADVGGLDFAADWWIEIVEASMSFHGKTRDQLDADVAEEIAATEEQLGDDEALWSW